MSNMLTQRMRRFLLAPVILLSIGLAATGCTTNAATGEQRFLLGYMSPQQQIALGEQALPQLTEDYGGEVPSTALQAYVTGIGEKLAATTEADNPSLPWKFTLLNSPVINAFALPGGKVFVSRGLAEKLTNEAQLAGVLGHEIAHVTAEHIAERVQAQTGTALLAQVLSAAAGSGDSAALQQLTDVIVGYGGQGYLLSFSRGQEIEADKLGMRYMSRAGYDPVAQRQVMEILEKETGGARPPEIMSTHPYPENRIAQIDELLATKYAGITGNPEYKLYPERYRKRFLNPISKIPEPKTSGGK